MEFSKITIGTIGKQDECGSSMVLSHRLLLGLADATHADRRWPGVGQQRDRRVRTTMLGLAHSCSGSILMVRLPRGEPSGLPGAIRGTLWSNASASPGS